MMARDQIIECRATVVSVRRKRRGTGIGLLVAEMMAVSLGTGTALIGLVVWLVW